MSPAYNSPPLLHLSVIIKLLMIAIKHRHIPDKNTNDDLLRSGTDCFYYIFHEFIGLIPLVLSPEKEQCISYNHIAVIVFLEIGKHATLMFMILPPPPQQHRQLSVDRPSSLELTHHSLHLAQKNNFKSERRNRWTVQPKEMFLTLHCCCHIFIN